MTRSLRIAIVELSLEQRSGTARPGEAMERVLRDRGHDVHRLGAEPGLLNRLQRGGGLWRRLTRASVEHPLELLADRMSRVLRPGRFDVVIARGFEMGHVLKRDLGVLRILDWPNVAYVEAYSTSESDLSRVDTLFRRERGVLDAADLVISPSNHLTRFIESTVPVDGLADKLITVLLGCDRVARTAQPSSKPRIVYAGSYYPIQDPYLLSRLTGLSPFPIDCYGPRAPADGHLPHRLTYRGFAADESFLSDYQVGLVTVARDRLREHSPATKLPYYFAHGLPVLFPAWMKEGHDFPACALPFEESTFAAQALRILEPGRWEQMSVAALAAAEQRSWNTTLAPLFEAIEGRVPQSANPQN